VCAITQSCFVLLIVVFGVVFFRDSETNRTEFIGFMTFGIYHRNVGIFLRFYFLSTDYQQKNKHITIKWLAAMTRKSHKEKAS